MFHDRKSTRIANRRVNLTKSDNDTHRKVIVSGRKDEDVNYSQVMDYETVGRDEVKATVGVDPLDVNEHHLQVILSQPDAATTIPTPGEPRELCWEEYGCMYPARTWEGFVSDEYIQHSETVEDMQDDGLADGFTYVMDERDYRWLSDLNWISEEKMEERVFELVMGLLEMECERQGGKAEENLAPYQHIFALQLQSCVFAARKEPDWLGPPSTLLPWAQMVHKHWFERRKERGGGRILPILDVPRERSAPYDPDPYICFRPRPPPPPKRRSLTPNLKQDARSMSTSAPPPKSHQPRPRATPPKRGEVSERPPDKLEMVEDKLQAMQRTVGVLKKKRRKLAHPEPLERGPGRKTKTSLPKQIGVRVENPCSSMQWYVYKVVFKAARRENGRQLPTIVLRRGPKTAEPLKELAGANSLGFDSDTGELAKSKPCPGMKSSTARQDIRAVIPSPASLESICCNMNVDPRVNSLGYIEGLQTTAVQKDVVMASSSSEDCDMGSRSKDMNIGDCLDESMEPPQVDRVMVREEDQAVPLPNRPDGSRDIRGQGLQVSMLGDKESDTTVPSRDRDGAVSALGPGDSAYDPKETMEYADVRRSVYDLFYGVFHKAYVFTGGRGRLWS